MSIGALPFTSMGSDFHPGFLQRERWKFDSRYCMFSLQKWHSCVRLCNWIMKIKLLPELSMLIISEKRLKGDVWWIKVFYWWSLGFLYPPKYAKAKIGMSVTFKTAPKERVIWTNNGRLSTLQVLLIILQRIAKLKSVSVLQIIPGLRWEVE